ncbi:hypothetical protein [Aurantiacibacter sp. D1-12]|uniref:hypothetical protein n=1 Tax=Aurantiacibacter sp. D1-12 TaxID=2993658 RepID=UPI00237CD9A4|nr:hypothetical protein [Aurantiacibacter sp. D1-12]MDE1468131.1 hypothetical protein [Aurantiacibacter sp. D1-12]
MLVQHCELDQHRLILPTNITKPLLTNGALVAGYSKQQYRALIDTGAQRTVLSRSVIANEELVRIGHMEFAGLHGPRTHTRYLASIGLWATRVEGGATTHPNNPSELTLFQLETPFEVVDMEDNQNFDLILGFDVLKLFSFSFKHETKQFEITLKP